MTVIERGVWRNRIVGHGDEPPEQLLANPANWRVHPKEHQQALAGALAEVGWVAQVLVNRTTGHVVDGHLRVELAISQGEPTVPVSYVELSEDEERLVLATLDPLAAMAAAEKDALESLLATLSPDDEALSTLLAELAEQNGIRRAVLGDPDDAPPVPDDADVYVRPDELWLLGDHRLLCGDATSPDDVARLLEGEEPTLVVEEEARAELESRYLAGQPSLLPDAEAAWDRFGEMVDRMWSMAQELVRLTAAQKRRVARDGDRLHKERVAGRARTLADNARITILDRLGENQRALRPERRLAAG